MKSKLITILIILLTIPSSLVAARDDLEITDTHDYINSINYLTIVGEIENKSYNPYTYVEIVASFLDWSGDIVNTTSTYTYMDTIMPGEISPFKLTVPANKDIDDYELQVQGTKGGEEPRDLKIRSTRISLNSLGYFEITGKVENNTDDPQKYVEIIATLYSGLGRLIGVERTYSSLDTIPPGDSSPFKITSDRGVSVVKYELQAQ